MGRRQFAAGLQTSRESVLLNSSAPLVELEAAGLRRGDRWPVRGVDLRVGPGEIVTLIGPNGSGKTTTAKLALGILAPDEGVVRRRAGLRVGYVPQRLSIDWTLPLTVGRMMTLTGGVDARLAADALQRAGVPGLWNEQAHALSGGQFQRVLLARAIARKPDLLVLDEPVQGADFSGEIALYDLIRQVRDETGCGVLLVSHDLHLVMAATDRVVCLNGHVCCEGAPAAVAASAQYRNLFGPRAEAVLAVYRHRHDHEHLPDNRVLHGDGAVTDHCHPGDGHHRHGHEDGQPSATAPGQRP